jgi:hydroxypyruvate isomerase
MLRFSANLGMLFGEVDFLERFSRARAAGFEAVEFPFPYAYPKEQLAALLQAQGLVHVLHNLPPGDWEAGERGIACYPGRCAEFHDGVGLAIEYARALGCSSVNCLVGLARGVPAALALETLVDNLRFAARELGKAKIRLLVEPINTRDMPGFFVAQSGRALEIMEAVGEENLWLQYDVYHMQVMEGDLARTIERHLPRIGHIQIADNPGRHEPGTGEINYAFLLPYIEQLGYAGWIGCEYKPLARTEQGLDWLAAYRSRVQRPDPNRSR